MCRQCQLVVVPIVSSTSAEWRVLAVKGREALGQTGLCSLLLVLRSCCLSISESVARYGGCNEDGLFASTCIRNERSNCQGRLSNVKADWLHLKINGSSGSTQLWLVPHIKPPASAKFFALHSFRTTYCWTLWHIHSHVPPLLPLSFDPRARI